MAPADDDDGFDAAGVPVDAAGVPADAVAADPLFLGLAEDVDDDLADAEEETEEDAEEETEEDAEEAAEEDAEEAAVDAAACVGAGVQVGFVVAPTPLLPGPAELVLVLVLVVGLAGGVEVAV